MIHISFYYYSILLMLFYCGIKLLGRARQSKGRSYIKFKKNILLNARKKIVEELSDPNANKILFEAGFKVDALHFNGIRYIFFISIILTQLLKWNNTGLVKPGIFLANAGIFFLTLPIENFVGIKTPFGLVAQMLKKHRMENIDKELFEAMTQLKNLCVVQGNTPLSGDFLMEQLIKFVDFTKPEFTKALTIWRLGNITLACDTLAESLNTKMGKELSGILSKLENMHPGELIEHLELYQNHIREVRMTQYLRRQEGLSHLLYAPVIVSAFLIMLNFMVIVIWMDAMQLIKNI